MTRRTAWSGSVPADEPLLVCAIDARCYRCAWRLPISRCYRGDDTVLTEIGRAAGRHIEQHDHRVGVRLTSPEFPDEPYTFTIAPAVTR